MAIDSIEGVAQSKLPELTFHRSPRILDLGFEALTDSTVQGVVQLILSLDLFDRFLLYGRERGAPSGHVVRLIDDGLAPAESELEENDAAVEVLRCSYGSEMRFEVREGPIEDGGLAAQRTLLEAGEERRLSVHQLASYPTGDVVVERHVALNNLFVESVSWLAFHVVEVGYDALNGVPHDREVAGGPANRFVYPERHVPIDEPELARVRFDLLLHALERRVLHARTLYQVWIRNLQEAALTVLSPQDRC